VNACARLSVSGLAGLLAQTELVIANDTGPMHLAAAVGTATIGIFWCQSYPNWAHLHRTNHRPLVSWITHCPDCGGNVIGQSNTNACGHNACYLTQVTVEDVLLHAYDLLHTRISQPQAPVFRSKQPNAYGAVTENFVERTKNDLLFRNGFHRFT
jgi:ADP-heptose:LPS heptosyltransferase